LQRDKLLKMTNELGVMTRPVWREMNTLSIYENAVCGSIPNTKWFAERIVNLPSSVRGTI